MLRLSNKRCAKEKNDTLPKEVVERKASRQVVHGVQLSSGASRHESTDGILRSFRPNPLSRLAYYQSGADTGKPLV
jgi:hypothetical protein